MKTQTIEVDVKPADGYRPIQESVEWVSRDTALVTFRFEKIQPRRIVLDENTLNDVCWVFIENYGKIMKEQYTNNLFNNIKPLLRIVIEAYLYKLEVEEIDISLTKEDPKLSLSVDEAKEIYTYSILINPKIIKFIKENS